jgi:DNA-binding transcriptional ArsR family regulator
MLLMEESVAIRATPVLTIGERVASLHSDGDVLARFRVRRVEALTRSEAERLAGESGQGVAQAPLLVSFHSASPQARALLRERAISYAGDDGERFLLAPPVYVELPGTLAPALPAPVRSPFAPRASRVPRWLLLHTDQSPSLTELARAVGLSAATVSRTVAALAQAGLVELVEDQRSSRIRRVRADQPRELLEALERSRWLTRARRQTWDVGAREAEDAFALWRQSAERLSLPYALGGPAGASLRQRVLQPADVLVWIRREDLSAWGEDLLAEPGRPSRGSVTVALAPDPFILQLTDVLQGLRVADPVQLYLDCRGAGERALEAAEAIRAAMHW